MYIMYSFWSHCEYILSTSMHHQTPGSLTISDLCTLILPTTCNLLNIKRAFKKPISILLFTFMLINTYVRTCKPQKLYQSVIRGVHY